MQQDTRLSPKQRSSGSESEQHVSSLELKLRDALAGALFRQSCTSANKPQHRSRSKKNLDTWEQGQTEGGAGSQFAGPQIIISPAQGTVHVVPLAGKNSHGSLPSVHQLAKVPSKDGISSRVLSPDDILQQLTCQLERGGRER